LIEGKKTLEELYKEGIFPDFQIRGRDAKFPQGESLNDLEGRIQEVIKEFVLPLIFEKGLKRNFEVEEEGEGGSDYHVGFVSHGLCLFEMVNALLKLDSEREVLKKYRGHYNTGWSRLQISLKVRVPSSPLLLLSSKILIVSNQGRT
jgi:broad specificity phosphatase PhoE